MMSKIVFYDQKMEITVKNGMVVYCYGELMYVIYDAPYCYLYFADKTKYFIQVSLQYLMDNLPETTFFRCNRSAIINVGYYKGFRTKPPVVVIDDKEFNLSRSNVKDFIRMKNNFIRTSSVSTQCSKKTE